MRQTALVIIPQPTDVEAYVEQILAPTGPYSASCGCLGNQARFEIMAGTVPSLEDLVHGFVQQQAPWSVYAAQYYAAITQALAAHPLQGKYDPYCPVCFHGTVYLAGRYTQWLRYEIGYVPPTYERIIPVSEIMPGGLPDGLVTPDGAFHWRTGPHWSIAMRAILAGYPQWYVVAVSLDCPEETTPRV